MFLSVPWIVGAVIHSRLPKMESRTVYRASEFWGLMCIVGLAITVVLGGIGGLIYVLEAGRRAGLVPRAWRPGMYDF